MKLWCIKEKDIQVDDLEYGRASDKTDNCDTKGVAYIKCYHHSKTACRR